jgi:hypothetical protein
MNGFELLYFTATDKNTTYYNFKGEQISKEEFENLRKSNTTQDIEKQLNQISDIKSAIWLDKRNTENLVRYLQSKKINYVIDTPNPNTKTDYVIIDRKDESKVNYKDLDYTISIMEW